MIPSFREFLLESGLAQDLPPDQDTRVWIEENREIFHKKHGKSEGERLLFATAWQNFNAINRSVE